MVFNIDKFLESFRKKIQNGEDLKDEIKQSIKEVCGIDVDKEDFEIRGNKVVLKTDPIIKTEIVFNKKKIIEKIQTDKSLDFF